MIEVYDLNNEVRRREREAAMSVEVKGLAAVVKQAKDAVRTASDHAARMQASAQRLTQTLSQVEDMTNELESANNELQAAVGQMSNGGPPLDQPSSTSSVSKPSVAVDKAAGQVEAANAAVTK
jgi:uncharacterized phage infection (PIP) family protein YhgE